MTKEKILCIKEAKDLFERRVAKLIRAQDYLLRSQEHQAIMAAQQIFIEKAKVVEGLFDNEAKTLKKEYMSISQLIRFYQRQLKGQCDKLALQEQIICKLQNHIAVNMNARLDQKLQKKQSANQLALQSSAAEPPKVLDFYRKEFDLFGMQLRLHAEEKERLVESVVVKEKIALVKTREAEVLFLRNQLRELESLLKVTMAEQIDLKIKLFEARNEISALHRQHELDITAKEGGIKERIAGLIEEIKRLCEVQSDQKEFAKMELKVKDAVIMKLERRLELFNDNSRKMKAVLRVPRLTKQFHDLMAPGNLAEFDCLERVYDHHYEGLGQSLIDSDGQDSPVIGDRAEQ